MVHRVPLLAFHDDCPFVVALIELYEGPRMVANIVGDGASGDAIGDAVEVCFEDRADM